MNRKTPLEFPYKVKNVAYFNEKEIPRLEINLKIPFPRTYNRRAELTQRIKGFLSDYFKDDPYLLKHISLKIGRAPKHASTKRHSRGEFIPRVSISPVDIPTDENVLGYLGKDEELRNSLKGYLERLADALP